MPEMMSYIFSTLEHSERFIRDQMKANRNIAAFILVISAYSVFQAKRVKALELRVRELEKEKEE